MARRGLSEFTATVLRIIRQIPRGQVTTYAAVAAAVGRPRAVRAVGTALGRNPHPGTQYPCHRVVRSDGTLGGYALGRRRKIAMLKREGVEVTQGKVQSTMLYQFRLQRKSQRSKP